ncbi:MAG: hypothetical protein NVSMB19_23120 [Vulcanimicrobiaceae bacterium]
MALALNDVRFYVNDAPRVYPPNNVSPEMIGQGDGGTTLFFISYPNVQVGSLAISFGTLVTQGTEQVQQLAGQPTSAYALNGQMVSFAIAPPAGTTVFARYTASAFSDVDLRGIMNRNAAIYVDDRLTLKGCLYDVLDILVTDIDRLKLTRYADYISSAIHVIQTLDAVKTNLRIDLEGGPRPGKQIPGFARQQGAARSFDVNR